MFKLLLTRIMRLWLVLMLIISLTVLLAHLQPNRALLYLEHTEQESGNIIWMLDTTQGVRQPLVQRANIAAFDLASDGRKLVYQVETGDASSVYLFTLDSAQHDRIAGANVECPRWSPDSQTLAYQNYDDYSLYLWDVRTGESTFFLYLGSGIARCSLDWTIDGNALVHSTWLRPNEGAAQVVATNIHTAESTTLLGIQRPVRHLTVSPDGFSIAYNGQPYATLVNMSTHEITSVAHFAYTFSAAWSPTQELIAFGYQKPLLSGRDAIVRGLAVMDCTGVIQYQADIGTVSHLVWWLRQ